MRLMPYALTFALAISMANPAFASAFYVLSMEQLISATS